MGSKYVPDLIANVQQSVRRHFDIAKLRFLLYPSRLLPKDVEQIKEDDAGVIWLGKDNTERSGLLKNSDRPGDCRKLANHDSI